MSDNKKEPIKVGATIKDPKKKEGEKTAADLSEEDARIKAEVELLVTRSGDTSSELVQVATTKLVDLLRTSRSGSAASVPKPLKYVRPHFETLLSHAETCTNKKQEENAKTLYDILSFVSMTRESTEEREKDEEKEKAEKEAKAKFEEQSSGKKKSEENKKAEEKIEKMEKKKLPFVPVLECITYKLKGHVYDIDLWGYEYVRHLGGDLIKKVRKSYEENEDTEQRTEVIEVAKDEILNNISKHIISYLVRHQDEPTACDFAMELDVLENLTSIVDDRTVDRICPYLFALCHYLPSDKDDILDAVFKLYIDKKRYAHALRVAFVVSNNTNDKIGEVFAACEDSRQKTQLGLMCGQFRSTFASPDGSDSELDGLIGNEKRYILFRQVAESLDCMAPKAPAEIFKEHVMDKHLIPQVANSHIHNLATSFVSGFSNAGFGKDTLVGGDAGDSWIFQTKEHRQMSAVANVGLLHLWDWEEGYNEVMRFNANPDNSIRAGVLLSVGIISSSIRHPYDAPMMMLMEGLSDESREMRLAAIVGLGLAYTGTARDDIKEMLMVFVVDGSQSVETQALAAHTLALVYIGTANEDVCEAVTMCLMEKTEEQLKEPTIRYLILALGLLMLRCKDKADGMIEMCQTLSPVIARYAETVVLSCAHCATGNVMIVQKLLAIVAEKPKEEDDADSLAAASAAAGAGAGGDTAAASASASASTSEEKKDGENKKDDKKDDKKPAPLWSHKSAALIGVALVALGESVGQNLVKRTVHHILLSKEDASISGRRGLPVALALLSISEPDIPVIDTLSKLSHDSDVETAQAAIIGMGLASAGSNNSRVATLLRNLSGYYHKQMDMLYIVRLAQGLCSLGKGHITCSPFKFDRTVVSTVALGGVLTFAHTSMDCEKTLLDNYHFMAFSLVGSMSPRMLMTVDDKLEKVDAHVRVGDPVDTVAVAGKPKSVTGFQTQPSPVLLQEGDRAELVPGKFKYIAPGTVLEGIVLVEPRILDDDDDDDKPSSTSAASSESKKLSSAADAAVASD